MSGLTSPTSSFDECTFDVVVCNHVLEHVPEDRKAMRELQRILKPGGWAVLLVPFDQDRAVTYEDWAIVDPDERERAFGQFDHVRVYGRDYVDRLSDAGFEVSVVRYGDELDEQTVALHGLRISGHVEEIFHGRKSAVEVEAGKRSCVAGTRGWSMCVSDSCRPRKVGRGAMERPRPRHPGEPRSVPREPVLSRSDLSVSAQKERDPNSSAGDGPRLAEEREDPGADERADTEERGAENGQTLLRRLRAGCRGAVACRGIRHEPNVRRHPRDVTAAGRPAR